LLLVGGAAEIALDRRAGAPGGAGLGDPSPARRARPHVPVHGLIRSERRRRRVRPAYAKQAGDGDKNDVCETDFNDRQRRRTAALRGTSQSQAF